MNQEVQAIIANISRLLHDFRNERKEEILFDKLEMIEKFLLSIEDYSND